MARKKKTALPVSVRPPVVAIMGHVDHGKTTLLSALKEFDLTKKEHGGITQHIGAYQLSFKKEKITFIDTPGHAAFAKMRSQGAAVTDLVVLVVAADDGVKPQTKESLAHIKQAKVPFLVAINKIDLPGASLDQVKAQLAEIEVVVEDYGGNVVCVPISAKQKKGLGDLLEMILLMAKMQDLKADLKADFQGIVVDSRLDQKKGPVATVLVKNGTLKTGTFIQTNGVIAKVKLMLDEAGHRVVQAKPSQPVLVLGFKTVPAVGALLTNVDQRGKWQSVSYVSQLKSQKKSKAVVEDQEEKEEPQEPEKIKIILKADTTGTLQALEANLSEEVQLILTGVGQVSESDVLLAAATGAQVISFNVKAPAKVNKLAEQEKVKIKAYNVIYEILEDLEKRVLQILEPTINETVLGEAEVIAEFTIKGHHIAGCSLKKGRINKKDQIHLKRKGKILKDLKIKSLQQEKQEINQAEAKSQVGIVFSPDIDFQVGDAIIAYSENK